MAQLAIKGHKTRGGEVIQRLEMLSGVNAFDLEGAETQGFYYIFKDNNKIYYCWSTNAENIIVYTLEEFEEKFPYKVGDDVLAYAEGCLAKFTIQDIRWNYELNKVEYKICSSWLDTSLMQPYKEEIMETLNNKTNKAIFESNVQSCDIMNDIIKKSIKETLKDCDKEVLIDIIAEVCNTYVGARIFSNISSANCIQQCVNNIQTNFQEVDNFITQKINTNLKNKNGK